MLLRDRVVILSGIGPGMGRELAICAAEEGARVVLAARSEDFLHEVASKLDAENLVVPTDITKVEDCQNLVARTVERFGRVDALVNSAYTMGKVMLFEEAEIDRWRVPMKVNYFGTLQLTQEVVPHMKAQGGGAIVMVGSIVTRKPMVNDTGYAASKAAIQAAARNLALELGPYGIRVNTIAIGWMWGPTAEGQVQRLAERRGLTFEEVRAEVKARIPLDEIPDDADCARAVLFLASEHARAINGALLDVNGGEYMPP